MEVEMAASKAIVQLVGFTSCATALYSLLLLPFITPSYKYINFLKMSIHSCP